MKHRAKTIARAGGAPRTVNELRGEPNKDALMERARRVQAKANAEASIARIDAWSVEVERMVNEHYGIQHDSERVSA